MANLYGTASGRYSAVLYQSQKFIGYVATKGAYLVNISENAITPIYAGNDAFQCKVDYAGKNLMILTLDGKLRIYDLSSGTLKKEGSVISAVSSADTYKPVLEATTRYAYIAVPALGEVHQIDLEDFGEVIKHKVSSKPVRLTLMGFESNAGHDD